MDIVRNYVEDWVSQYLPKTPEPPTPARQRIVYISNEMRDAVSRARTKAAPTAATVPDDEESDDEVENLPPPPPKRASPRGSPRGSPRNSPRGSPRSAAGARGSHNVTLDEPTKMSASPNQVPVRGQSPRRQQMHRVVSVDDDAAIDRIGALDNATARVIVRHSLTFQPRVVLPFQTSFHLKS